MPDAAGQLTTDHLPTTAEKQAVARDDDTGKKRPRAVLLNPPGTRRYFRDYFCSLTSKAHYYYHPIDLVYLSGVLDRAGFLIECMDAIAEGWSPQETHDRIVRFQPQLVVYLISSPSYDEDAAFLSKLRGSLPAATFVGSGDIYRELRERALSLHPFCDAVLTDFSTGDLVSWLQRTDDRVFENVIYRGKEGQAVIGPEHHLHGHYHLPVPRWDLWPLHRYRFPFSTSKRWATVLTDFGCPYSCTFCPMSTTGYKLRDLDTVMDELRLLRALGIREVFFRDQTFGVNRARTGVFLKRLRQECPRLRWICWSRVDIVTETFLQQIRAAGCHTIMYGIESSNEEILRTYKKRTNRSQIERALALSRAVGLKTVGTVIIGLPGDTETSIRATIDYVCSLPIDFVSFNIATPRFGSRFRETMLSQHALEATTLRLDSSHMIPLWQEQDEILVLPRQKIQALHSLAVRRFYLRPTYIFRRLLSLRSLHQLRNQLLEGWYLFSTLRRKDEQE